MMGLCLTCARRGAIVAALCGAGAVALAGAELCAGALVRGGTTCLGYIWSVVLAAAGG